MNHALKRNITLFYFLNFFTDFKLYAPLAIVYFAQVSGSFALGMSIFSVIMFSAAVFEIPTGLFSDLLGRKKTLVLGTIASTVGVLCYALGGSYWILIIGAVFEGLSRALYSGNNNALLYDTIENAGEMNRYEAIQGKTDSMCQAALAISGLLGGLLVLYSFPLVLWISVAAQLCCFITSLFITEPPLHNKREGNIYVHLRDAIQQFFTNKKLRLLSLSSIIGYGLGEASYQFQAAFYQTVIPLWLVGVIKSFTNVAGFMSFYFSGWFIKRFGALKLLLVDNVVSRLATMGALLFPTALSPVFMSLTSLFFGITTVSQGTLMQKEFTSHQRATMASLNSLAGSLFLAIVAVGLGYVGDIAGPAIALLLIQLLSLPTIFFYLKLYRHK